MTGRTVLLTLPWPPSTNKIWRAVAGRILLSSAARTYLRKLGNTLPTGHVVPLTGRLHVTVTLCPPASLKGAWDIANREKLANDGLTKQRVWLDDSQIDVLTLTRGEATQHGCMRYDIRELD